MKSSGCHGDQSKKSSRPKPLIGYGIIILQECSVDTHRDLQNSFK